MTRIAGAAFVSIKLFRTFCDFSGCPLRKFETRFKAHFARR